MRITVPVVLSVASVVVAGCAGPRYAQEVTRLRADVNLLNERLGQIERGGIGQPSAWPTDAPLSSAAETTDKHQPGLSLTAKPSKKEIQQALKNAGFYQGPIDGKLGSQTREAVKEFQRINGLKADGVVGNQTWDKLAPYLELASTTPPETASAGTFTK